ncbi:MAG: carboxylating nicotinate-nucleotide diphosphorylase [Thermoplasmata archaeon]|nr:carboxylating nicotinate-nucleotide diphosphorylase [Thermoplasmata archaeon]MCI4359564.1 carboxylating nicotinate-nucleotide diphosphorylase [Thermoplasmata archaeon]
MDQEAGRLLARALQEDRATQDRTSQALFPTRRTALAYVIAERDGVASGMRAVTRIGRRTGLRVRSLVRDGARLRPGARVLELRGELRTILAVERSVLNFLMHLSGVATATRSAVRAARGSLEIYGTRKTIPGLRNLEKEAIVHGGGRPHRNDLASGLLVKTNHLAFVPIREAVRRLRRAYGGRWPIEVEVRNAREAKAAIRAGADALLIDNAPPARARAIVRAARDRSRPPAPLWIEVSGGLSTATLARYRSVGADAASLGELTHSARALPFHLRFVRERPSKVRRAAAHRRR